jgi:CheY-like chemotaxis protein
LRTALISLYDPAVLRNSPLVRLLGADQEGDAVSRLRRILIEAIESLRPNVSTPQGSRSWRVYQILRRRYIEQLTQQPVASDLGLSIRQLQREEKLAREILADYLRTAYDLTARQLDLGPAAHPAAPAQGQPATYARELELLRDSLPPQMTDISAVLQGLLETIAPLLKSSGVAAECQITANSPCILLQAPLLRQALLNIVSTAIGCVPGGRIHIQSEVIPSQVTIRVCAISDAQASFRQKDYAESLDLAEQLICLAGGTLTPDAAAGEAVFARTVRLPATKQATVLVVDDNADTLQLFQRYLSGSRYCMVGTQDAQRGLALAEELAPQIIVLDVMMPERDGWMLLGQLREHPKTRDVPVIVCTILPEEQLALTLGAADFIRKPVKREDLLSALDQQVERLSKAPR